MSPARRTGMLVKLMTAQSTHIVMNEPAIYSLDPKLLVQLIHFHCPVLKLLHPATISWDLLQELVQWQFAASVLH